MAVTQNTYTGNGSTVLYSFTFPYLETTDIKVSVNGTVTTAYTLANATTIQFNTAPANGAAIRIYRQTDDSALAATFYPGSAIRSQDLNENFTQNLYVTQESTNNAATATTTANTALTNSTTAIGTANTALSTANTASSNASAAVATANTASSNASAAVSTANTASSNATTAVNTANAATATANSAASDAATALSTANTASSNASAAVATANTASSNASAAVSTANTASSNATTAVNTANNALSTANAAQSTANTADANANAALNAIAGTVQFVLVANVASIPGSPGNGDAIEIADSTGIENFSPLNNRPAGFVGDSGLSVRLQYLSAGSSWNWLNYFPNNAETRYLKFGGGTITGNLEIGNSGSLIFEGSTANAFETTLAVTDPTADRTITLPDVSGTVVTTGDTGSVTSTMIADGTIVNGDINASAAIAGTKISPDFGSQNVTTTGTSTAASFIPTSSTAPTNGVYLPAANSVAISTNGTGRLFVDSAGRVDAHGPNLRLHSYGVGASFALRRSEGTQAAPTAVSSASSIAGINLQGYDGSNFQRVAAISAYSDGAISSTASPGYLIIETTPSGSITPQERLRITSAGNVGIGTTSPYSILYAQESNTTTPSLTWQNTAGQIFRNSNVELAFGVSGSSPFPYYMQARDSASAARSLVINPLGGNVGIGTTSPLRTLQVGSTSGGNVELLIGSNTSSFGALLFGDGDAGLDVYRGFVKYEHSVDALSFGVGSTERFRCDASGRVLVGTSSARANFYNGSISSLFQVEGSGDFPGRAASQVFGNAGADGPIYIFGKHRSNSIGGTTVVQSGDQIGVISFQGSDGTEFVESASIRAEVDGTPGANDMPGRLVFSTTADGASSPTERMRISNNGYVGINGTATRRLEVLETRASEFAAAITNSSATGHSLALVCNSSDTVGKYLDGYSSSASITRIAIFSNGNVVNTNNSYGAISDARLKENITDASSQWDDIKSVQVRNYNLKTDPNHRQIGVVAQEIEQVSPGLVYECPDRDAEGNDLGTVTKSVNYSVLYMKAVKALQEAMERIETLEAKVAALESA